MLYPDGVSPADFAEAKKLADRIEFVRRRAVERAGQTVPANGEIGRAFDSIAGLEPTHSTRILARLRDTARDKPADIERDTLVKIARAGAVSIRWLATGEGHPDDEIRTLRDGAEWTGLRAAALELYGDRLTGSEIDEAGGQILASAAVDGVTLADLALRMSSNKRRRLPPSSVVPADETTAAGLGRRRFRPGVPSERSVQELLEATPPGPKGPGGKKKRLRRALDDPLALAGDDPSLGADDARPERPRLRRRLVARHHARLVTANARVAALHDGERGHAGELPAPEERRGNRHHERARHADRIALAEDWAHRVCRQDDRRRDERAQATRLVDPDAILRQAVPSEDQRERPVSLRVGELPPNCDAPAAADPKEDGALPPERRKAWELVDRVASHCPVDERERKRRSAFTEPQRLHHAPHVRARLLDVVRHTPTVTTPASVQ